MYEDFEEGTGLRAHCPQGEVIMRYLNNTYRIKEIYS